MIYKHILKPILFKFDPELVHDQFVSIGEILGKYRISRQLTDMIYGYHENQNSQATHRQPKVVDGNIYRTPIILSAGFDYNARLLNILPHIGFGGEEVGSVTARPCSGNPEPRLKRLPHSKAIAVNKGLKNDGVDVIIERIKRYQNIVVDNHLSKNKQGPSFVLGISIARTNDAQSAASIQDGINDYLYSFKRLNEENIGDYYTINISCPNAFGGEAFTKPELLDRLLAMLKTVPCNKPIYIKMPINLPWEKYVELLKIIDAYQMHGVIIGNLNKNYADLEIQSEAPKEYIGGLSGKPCNKLSTDLIRKTRALYGKRFTIIGVGGIMTPEDAQEKIAAGADLIQLISGMIFEGPGLVKKIAAAL